MISYFPTYLPLFIVIMLVVTRRPAHILRRRGAITPDTAQPVEDFKRRDRQRLDRLVAKGWIREASPGQYYYDVEGERARMRRKRPWLIGIIVVLVAIALALAYFTTPNVDPLP